ncbi:hypothetical protein BSKO_10136 [Bryopsis sp. KO-2023]|nr:hypothetical protein BSKO_10136 [Bryopsis sp. KO-2023]
MRVTRQMTRKRTRASPSTSQSKRRLVHKDSLAANAAKERFEQAYADLRKKQGLPVIYYSARGDYVFHLFGLHKAVSMNGGFDEVCSKSLWGHLAGEICKVSKRQIAAAREAELCYKEHILPFEKKLRDLDFINSTAAPSTPSASCSGNPSSPVSGSQNRHPGFSLNGATGDTCLSTVQTPDLYSWSNVHVVSVKVAGFPFCPHLPVVVGPSALINPDGIRPDLIPPADRDGATSQSDTSSLGNRTPSIKSRGSVPEVTAPSSSREADFGFLRLVSVPVSDVKTSRSPAKRHHQSSPASKVFNRADTSNGDASLGPGGESSLCESGDGNLGDTPSKSSNPKKRSFSSATPSPFQETKVVDDPWEVADPVPGNREKSRIRWVRELARDAGEASANWSRHEVLHLRYGGELRRSHDKLCFLARRKYKDALERMCSASVSSDSDSDSASEEEEEEEEEEEPLDVREGVEYQAEIPAWRPKPQAPTADEARWLSAAPIWPLPPAENGTLNGMEGCSHIPRPDNFYTDVEARHQWVDRSSKNLEESLGAAAQDMGVSNIGYRVAQNWTPEEEALFMQGMVAVGRDFEQLQAKFLPHKEPAQVVGYYYNIWKLGRTKSARQWYAEIAEEKARVLREEEEQLRKEEDEFLRLEEKRREARYKANQRRAFKNILVWIKGVGQNPFNINLVQRGKTISRGLNIRELRRMEGADKALEEYFQKSKPPPT